MKKILWSAIAVLSMAGFLASCEKDQPKEPEASLQIQTPTVAFATEEAGEQEATFVVNKKWTATPSEQWIKVTPASGEAGTITVKIAVEANTGEARGGKVTINVEKITKDNVINVTQGAYIPPKTIKEFATEYVKIIDIWEATVGPMKMHSTVDAVENAHYIPAETTIKVGDKTYNTADMLETALRSYLLIRGYDGLDTENYGAGKIAALAGGAVGMAATPVPDTHEYEWGADSPFNETAGNGGHLNMIVDGKNVHSQVKVDILDNWAQRALNFQHGKTISNMCTYPRDPITDYTGSFCSQRALLTYAFFFKYMLDNNLDKGTEVADDVIIRSELFGDEVVRGTIADFAAEYVKILDLWANNVGEKKMHSSVDATPNAHFVPEDATITVGDFTYNTADMLELALRSYLLIRGFDGNDTENYGAGKIAALDSALSISAPLPETHGYQWGEAPCNETSGNGGNFAMIGANNLKDYGWAKVDVLDNWAQRALNFQHGKTISNMCTYPRDPITDYTGSFCSQRALLTYAFFFKYMLDNNLDKGTEVADDVIIRSELFGDEVVRGTIADFAAEYVKILDLWANNVGEKKMHSSVDATPNAHFVPEDATITVGDFTYNTADMLELALRSYLLIRGFDGNDTENYGAGKIAALDSALSISAPLPETHGYQWGEAPCNETSGNGGNFAMVRADNLKDYGWAKVDVLDNWAQRALNYSHGKPISNMCTYPRDPITNYHGSFSSMRALITYAYFFKYMLNKNYTKGTDVTADETFRTDLFGVDGQQIARWEFSAAAAGATETSYGYTFGGAATVTNGVFAGNAYLYNPAAGDGGHYVDANWNGDGRITFVQIDKTSMSGNTNAGHNVGSTGHVCCKGNWTGDYWLFKATSASQLGAGTKIHAKYIFRSSASGPGYFLVQYKDGEEWKDCSLQPDKGDNAKSDGTVLGTDVDFALATPETITIGSETITYNARSRANGTSNTTVDTVFELTVPTTTVELRAVVAGVARPDGGKTPTSINGGTTRLAGSTINVNGAFTSPIIEIAQFAK